MATDGKNVASETPAGLSRRKRILRFAVGACVGIGICYSAAHTSPEIWAKFFALFLLAGLPALSWASILIVRRKKGVLPPRLKLYRSVILFDWVLAVLAFDVLMGQELDLEWVGFDFVGSGVFLGWCLALAVGSVVIVTFVHWLEARGWLRPGLRGFRLVPETRSERLACVLLLAPSVGFCEELLYRGYLMAELPSWLHANPLASSWALSSLAFGLAHIDQGFGGVVRATMLGALWTCPVMHSGTLYPSMVVHAVYDAVVLAWLGPKLLRRVTLPSPVQHLQPEQG